MNRFGGDRGFTLIELLIVIAIIGFLAAAILVAVDPVKRVNQARNAKRWSEANSILNAILKKQVDKRAAFLGEASTAPIVASATNSQVIAFELGDVDCTATATQPDCPGQTLDTSTQYSCIAKMDALVDDPSDSTSYLAELAVDPLGVDTEASTGYLPLGPDNTGYYIHKYPNGRIEIGSCYPDEGETISVKR